jgi:hypothetical protein
MKPWKGKDYEKQNIKVLVLGQSLYGGKAYENRIIDETKWYLDEENCRGSTFARKTRNILNFQDLKNSAFWNSIAHYEYLLNPKSGPGDTPTKEELDEARDPFFKVLNSLSPTVVAVLGISTFNVLGLENHYKTVKKGNASMEIWKYDDIYFLRIPHPSGSFGFSEGDWQRVICGFLEKLNG